MCCLYGLIDTRRSLPAKEKSRIISALAAAAEVRGTDATGIAYNSKGRLCIFKRPWPAHFMRFHIPQNASVIMGHTRMTTQGNAKWNYNNHPFPGHTGGHDFALAHNGILYNDDLLREELSLPVPRIETDSYIAVQLLEQKEALDLNSLQFMAEQVRGSFTFTVLDDADNLYFVKGDNPLCLWHFKSLGIYLYASTEEILGKAVQKLGMQKQKYKAVALCQGDILRISKEGAFAWARFKSSFPHNGWYRLLWRPYSYDGGQTHLDMLKSMAALFGYCPEEIEELHRQGFTTDEIEESFYCGY